MDDLGFWSIWQSELLLNHFAVLYRGGYNDLINPGLTLQNLWPCFPMLSMFEIKPPVALRRKQQLNLPTAKCYVWVNIDTSIYKIEAFMLNMTNVCGSGINHDLTLPRVLIYQSLVLIRLVNLHFSCEISTFACDWWLKTVTPEISGVHWDHDPMIPGMVESMFEAKNQQETTRKPLEYRYFEDFSIGNTEKGVPISQVGMSTLQ